MITNHPYPYQPLSPEEIEALIRRAHAERAQAIRAFFAGLFRHKPDRRTDAVPATAACS